MMKMTDMMIKITTGAIFLTAMLFIALVNVYSGESGKLPGGNNGGKLPGRNNEATGTPIVVSESELREAALKGDTEKMRSLIAAGADINQPVTFQSHQTVLMIAAEKGHNELVKLLLEAGADINAVDGAGPDDLSYDQNNAFMYAVRGGHYDTVKLFIDLGVEINQQNRARWTPIKIAAYDGYNDIAQLLLVSCLINNLNNLQPLDSMVTIQKKEVIYAIRKTCKNHHSNQRRRAVAESYLLLAFSPLWAGNPSADYCDGRGGYPKQRNCPEGRL